MSGRFVVRQGLTERKEVMPTKAVMAERAEAMEQLRALVEESNGIVYTILRHKSASGMLRVIDPIVMIDGRPHSLAWSCAKATGDKIDRDRGGIRLGGCGMDMGFALVYSIGRSLWPQGYPCMGEKCGSNDHSNGDRDYTPGHVTHNDGGYRLEHRWL